MATVNLYFYCQGKFTTRRLERVRRAAVKERGKPVHKYKSQEDVPEGMAHTRPKEPTHSS